MPRPKPPSRAPPIPPVDLHPMSLSLPLVRTGVGVLRWCRVAFGILGIALGAAAALLVVAGLVLHWAILPHLDNWRPRIEAMVSRSLGAPVRIGRIGVDTDAWVPSFDLGDVVLYDADHHEALRLPRVRAALSAAAFSGSPGFSVTFGMAASSILTLSTAWDNALSASLFSTSSLLVVGTAARRLAFFPALIWASCSWPSSLADLPPCILNVSSRSFAS